MAAESAHQCQLAAALWAAPSFAVLFFMISFMISMISNCRTAFDCPRPEQVSDFLKQMPVGRTEQAV